MNITPNHLPPDKQFYRGGLIDLSDFTLVQTQADNHWDAFIARSPERSIFMCSTFLNACGHPHALYWCLKKKQKVAAVAISLDSNTLRPTLETPVVYNGIALAPSAHNKNLAQIRSARFSVLCFLCNALISEFPDLKLRLPPQIDDIRPFSWHNYDVGYQKVKIGIQYTSILNICPQVFSVDNGAIGMSAEMSASRRQDIRYALKKEYKTTECYDIDIFRKLLRETFLRQNKVQNSRENEQYLNITKSLHAAGLLRAFNCGLPESGIEAIALFGVIGNRAVYLYGAGRQERRKSYAGTAVLQNAFERLAADGICYVDLEGVNSPSRGYFKLSFGGSLTPYFTIESES